MFSIPLLSFFNNISKAEHKPNALGIQAKFFDSTVLELVMKPNLFAIHNQELLPNSSLLRQKWPAYVEFHILPMFGIKVAEQQHVVGFPILFCVVQARSDEENKSKAWLPSSPCRVWSLQLHFSS